jgi:hypothetical protein
MFQNVIKIYCIYSLIMRYMVRPHRAIFRQHIIKVTTALCTLSLVLLKYYIVIIIIIINLGVVRCLFFLSFALRPLCSTLGVPLSWSCVSCDIALRCQGYCKPYEAVIYLCEYGAKKMERRLVDTSFTVNLIRNYIELI